jgi:uncharacterized membrane protein
MANEQTQLVIAYFDTSYKADTAARALKSWDKANDEVKLGAIGVLYEAPNGKIKTKKYGPHNTGKGAKIGLLLGVLAAVLGPVTLVAGAAYGAAGGGIVGTFSRKGLGLSDEELTSIKTQLAEGKAALAVLAEPQEVEAITAELASLGGTTEEHDAPTDEIQQVATEVNAPPPDEVEGATTSASN